MIAEPPLLAGATHDSTTCPFAGTPATLVGKPGTVLGVTVFDDADTAPAPAALTAATLNVYAVPFAKPVNVKLVAADPTSRAVAPVTPVGAPPEPLNTVT